MRAIISRGLYIFYPIFKDHFFIFKEVFSENSVLMYGLYSSGASNQERLIMARVRYLCNCNHRTAHSWIVQFVFKAMEAVDASEATAGEAVERNMVFLL